MKGRKVERRFGWDCHGLPVEYEMEKELGISGKKQIEEYGVAKFNEACRSIVLRYTREWRKVITRLGRWVDFDHDYKTMDPDYMESIWWVLSELWKKGLIYEGFYILPVLPPLLHVAFQLRAEPRRLHRRLGPRHHGEVRRGGRAGTRSSSRGPPRRGPCRPTSASPWARTSLTSRSRTARSTTSWRRTRLPAYYKDPAAVPGRRPLHRQGAGRAGHTCRCSRSSPTLKEKGAFRTWIGDFVTTEDGTGIVHIAPGFGEDDYNLLKGSGIPVVCPGGRGGEVHRRGPRLGRAVREGRGQVHHPEAEGAGQPLVRHDSVHAQLSPLLALQEPADLPRHLGVVRERGEDQDGHARGERRHLLDARPPQGRAVRQVAGERPGLGHLAQPLLGQPHPRLALRLLQGEWNASAPGRSLEQKTGRKVEDLHKHFIDELTYPCSCGGTMRRIPEVLDCWFESGAMPYGQNHYPFENRERFEAHFPADFISESIDQTRGWFYTLVVLGAALFNKPTFRNVIVSGLILDSEGKKMSKSARNYTDPMEVIGTYGADAMRLFLLDSAVLKAEDLRFSDAGVKEVVKNVIIPLWNSYSFFVTYANIDSVTVDGCPAATSPIRWTAGSSPRRREWSVKSPSSWSTTTCRRRWMSSSASSTCSTTGTSGARAGASGARGTTPTSRRPTRACTPPS